MIRTDDAPTTGILARVQGHSPRWMLRVIRTRRLWRACYTRMARKINWCPWKIGKRCSVSFHEPREPFRTRKKSCTSVVTGSSQSMITDRVQNQQKTRVATLRGVHVSCGSGSINRTGTSQRPTTPRHLPKRCNNHPAPPREIYPRSVLFGRGCSKYFGERRIGM